MARAAAFRFSPDLLLRCPFCWGRCFRQKRFCWAPWEQQRLRVGAAVPEGWLDASPIHSEVRQFLRSLWRLSTGRGKWMEDGDGVIGKMSRISTSSKPKG